MTDDERRVIEAAREFIGQVHDLPVGALPDTVLDSAIKLEDAVYDLQERTV